MECFISKWITFGLVYFACLTLSFTSLPLWVFFSFLCVIIIAGRFFFYLCLYNLYSVLQFNLQFLTARGEFSQWLSKEADRYDYFWREGEKWFWEYNSVSFWTREVMIKKAQHMNYSYDYNSFDNVYEEFSLRLRVPTERTS